MFNWFTQFFQRTPRQRLQAQVPHIERVSVHHSTPSDLTQQATHHAIYQHSPWVHVAVSRIAEAGALVPLHVLRLDGEQRVAIERHPLENLLDHPNPTMSRFELFEATLGYLELTGNAFWFLSGDGRGQPAQIWVLRPDRMTIIPHPQRHIAGYVYEVDGVQIPFDPIEIVHFKRWHPSSDHHGLSPIEAGRLAVESDRAMARWNQNTFGKDNGVPAGIVNINEFVSDDDYERLKREWRNSYGGSQRKTAFLRGGAVTWQHIGLSHTDLDFLQGRIAHRDEILNLFGIPVGLVSENATEANARVAERQFIERTLYPKLVRIAQKITQDILPFYGADLIAQFEDIRPTDTQARLDEIRTAQAVLTVNEIRQQYYNLPSVTWGDALTGQIKALPAPLPEPTLPTKSPLDELAQWERFALNRLDHAPSRPFRVDAVPDEIAFEISAGLHACPDADAIRTLFSAVRARLE
ncbi:MAG: phage portal protein [Anaerolineae bacterium]